jgi:hypothetical protein
MGAGSSSTSTPTGPAPRDRILYRSAGPASCHCRSTVRRKSASQEPIEEILADFISLGLRSDKPAHVACRCTVFTKSDMIHLQNKGERLEDIIYGLHVGNARNYISTIVSNRVLHEPILFVGGLSLNELQIRSFRPYFPGLIVPEHSTSTGRSRGGLERPRLGIRNRLNLEVPPKGARRESSICPQGEDFRFARPFSPRRMKSGE